MQRYSLCVASSRQPNVSSPLSSHSSTAQKAVFFGARHQVAGRRRTCTLTQFRGGRRTQRGVPQAVIDVTQDNFEEEVLKADKVVLVDFWAEWCGPCKLVAPLLPQIEKEFAIKVVKINADPSPNLVEKYKVYGLPTLILFKDGKMIEGSLREGAIAKKPLMQYLEKFGLAPATM